MPSLGSQEGISSARPRAPQLRHFYYPSFTSFLLPLPFSPSFSFPLCHSIPLLPSVWRRTYWTIPFFLLVWAASTQLACKQFEPEQFRALVDSHYTPTTSLPSIGPVISPWEEQRERATEGNRVQRLHLPDLKVNRGLVDWNEKKPFSYRVVP